ncbi:MAG: hypothetical protein PHR98_01855 [Candidatus Shapirobacteria bacterium]|nr:hypothetical protein [Candidatus Shapirobacteria bacterium]
MITHSICKSLCTPPDVLRLGFSVWARNSPKDYLSIYPKAAEEVQKKIGAKNVFLCALVDDVWPIIALSRTHIEQQNISNQFITLLPNLGFHEVHLVSDFVRDVTLGTYLPYATRVTISEFWKLLPQSKKNILDNLTLNEILGFLWHIHVLQIALREFKLTGLLVGIRSEFFYLTARKLLSSCDVYFINTS